MKPELRRVTGLLKKPNGDAWAKYYVDLVVGQSHKRSSSRDFEVFALRFTAVDSEGKSGSMSFSLEDFFHRLRTAKVQLEREIAERATNMNLDLTWLHGELPLDQRLQILRDDHQQRTRSGELIVTDEHLTEGEELLSLSRAAEYAGVSVGDLIDLERRGLLVCKRTNGGRRRYGANQLENAKRLVRELKTGTRPKRELFLDGRSRDWSAAHETDEPMAAMSAPVAQPARILTPSQRRHLTVITVAQLYVMAFFRFPEREGSVVEFIRREMEWLSASQVTTYVRQARHRNGIPLPIFRQGRIRTRKPAESPNRSEDDAKNSVQRSSSPKSTAVDGQKEGASALSPMIDSDLKVMTEIWKQLLATQKSRKQTQR